MSIDITYRYPAQNHWIWGTKWYPNGIKFIFWDTTLFVMFQNHFLWYNIIFWGIQTFSVAQNYFLRRKTIHLGTKPFSWARTNVLRPNKFSKVQAVRNVYRPVKICEIYPSIQCICMRKLAMFKQKGHHFDIDLSTKVPTPGNITGSYTWIVEHNWSRIISMLGKLFPALICIHIRNNVHMQYRVCVFCVTSNTAFKWRVFEINTIFLKSENKDPMRTQPAEQNDQ